MAADDLIGDDSILHPVITLHVSPTAGESGARVSSVCFLSKQTYESDSSDDDDNDETIMFRSRQLVGTTTKVQNSVLSNFLLASCHTNGDAYLWDLQSKRMAYKFPSSGTSGLAMKCVDGNKLAYQTRDGMISIFDSISSDGSFMNKILEWNTSSQGFCAMAISRDEDHIIAIPSSNFECTIRDVRQSIAQLPIDQSKNNNNDNVLAHFEAGKGHGMLMSLAVCHSIVACGMEDGTVCFHDWRKATQCTIKLSQNFILGLDLVQSVSGSVLAIAGMAGNAEELKNLPESDQGTVAIIKCTVEPSLHAKLRSRACTCSLGGGGKPGVDVARFRPDGRLFAIGGWDKRIRLFDRSSAKGMAMLKGHTGSVTTLDWASNAIMVSGDDDGTIHIWHAIIQSKS